ncbi:hypothetical protein ACFQZ1_10640 [Bacillus sp. CGMCC 1.60114]|uniref:hypothetical protein n=1 Tax=unclassified Bacillus (in: firmicutes) TaxID=185979 RepID=UPI00362C7C6D
MKKAILSFRTTVTVLESVIAPTASLAAETTGKVIQRTINKQLCLVYDYQSCSKKRVGLYDQIGLREGD